MPMPTPAEVRLWLYNTALYHLGSRKLASLTENRETRRVLDSVWDANFVDYLLERAQWKFALRYSSLSFAPSITPAFGHRYAFNKPEDFKRISRMCEDEYFTVPLTRYYESGGYWFADLDTLYVCYVSNDPAYGADLSQWTDSFRRYAALHLAAEAAPRIKEEWAERIGEERDKAEFDAKALDAMEESTRFFPPGRWVSARTYRTRNQYDRSR